MAIIYSYPTVAPTVDDLVLGTDVNQPDKPTKNFSIQSIVDLIQGTATGLAAVLLLSNDAGQQAAVNFTNVQGTGTFTAGIFTDGTMVITAGGATGFNSIQSTNFSGDLTGVIKAGSSIEGTVTGVTQPLGTTNTTLATTKFVMDKVDPSILTFTGTTGGNQTVNLVNQTFSLLGTANQIESVSTGQTIRFNFPAAGVVLPDGSTATTQALTDNSTDVATTAFVHSHSAAQDLDFSGDNGGTGSVLLDSQVFAINGTANQITTTQSGQSLTIAMPTNITVSGIVNATTFAGDLNGTVNTLTTGVTQPLGNDTTKIATTAFVERAAGAKTLQYQGDTGGPFDLNLKDDDLDIAGGSNISTTAATVATNLGVITIDLNDNVTISGTSKADTFTTTAGTATWVTTVLAGFTKITSALFVGDATATVTNFQGNASSASRLGAADGTIQLLAGSGVTQGVASNAVVYTDGGDIEVTTSLANTTVTAKTLLNLPTPTSTTITAGDSILAAMAKLQGQITGIPQGLVYKGTWNANTNTPTLASGVGVTGEFYIVSVAGTTNLDGITDWQIGDWAIFVEVGATDTWQKIDNSQSIIGSGATNKIAKWTAPTVLGTGLIEDDGTTVTIGANGNLTVEGDTILGDSAANDTLTINGPGTFVSTAIFNVGIGLGGAAYGSAGQVLTSGGASGSANTWTTPTVGTVTSVGLTETGNALTITGSPITSSGTINIAGAGSASQYINGALDLVTFPTVDNYQYWILSDGSSTSNITTLDTAVFAAGNGITTSLSGDTITTAIDVSGTNNAIAVLNTAVPVATDTLWFNDISGPNTIRKATIADIVDLGNETLAQVLTNGNTTGGTDIAVSAADITFTDTSKAIFGAGNDLKIYHDGSNSYIQDTSGTGDLRVDTNTFRLRSSNGGETMIRAFEDGAVILSHNNLDRLTTTNTGVTVTGGLTAGTGNFSGNVELKSNAGGATKFLRIWNEGTVDASDDALITWQTQASRTYSMGIHRDSGLLTITNQDASVASGELITVDTNGNTVISGNLTVDGNIINGSGGGTFNGNKAITSGASALAFTLTRAVTGTLVFDVWLTSGTSNLSSVAKKYTVAHSFNSTPVYNKIIDTGPNNTNDFTVTFANSNTGANGTSVTCSIISNVIAANNIGYTVQVGHESVRALTFTAG